MDFIVLSLPKQQDKLEEVELSLYLMKIHRIHTHMSMNILRGRIKRKPNITGSVVCRLLMQKTLSPLPLSPSFLHREVILISILSF